MFLTVLRIRDVYPGPDFPIPDQEGTGSRIPDPGPRSGFLSNLDQDPGSKGLKNALDSGSQIPDPGPQHWFPLYGSAPRTSVGTVLLDIFYVVD